MTYEQTYTRGGENSSGRNREDLGASDTHAADQVRRQAQEKFEHSRGRAAGGMDSVASAASAAAEDLRNHNQEGLSRYVSEIADSVSSVASSLRHKSVDELIHEVEDIARRNPTLFLAGSLAVGLGIGRFARASSKSRSDRYRENDVKPTNFPDENYPRNVSGDAEPERTESYGSGRVSEEDYLADDFTSAGGEPVGAERGESHAQITSKQPSRQNSAGNGNQPIGGDFYE